MATATERLLTADEYAKLPDPGYPTELVRGRIIAMNPPIFRHGVVCRKLVHLVQLFLDDNDLGQMTCNDSGVITERDPDTVRGADAAFYSYARLPKDVIPETYPEVSPEVVFEVRSPSDRSSGILRKVSEYLAVGVLRVCVLDPQHRTLTIYSPDQPEDRLDEQATFSLPEILPGFAVPVARFFD